MSIATITEPSIETSTATDRLTEALEQKLSHPATSPDFDLHAETNEVLKDIGLTTEASSHSTDPIRFSQARSGSGRWPQSAWPREASQWRHFGNTPPAKDRI